MKSLVAILFLINCLAFFMFSHMQKQSQLKADEVRMELDLPISSPEPVKLISELSASELQALESESVESLDDADIESAER